MGELYDQICSWENLRLAYRKAARGKRGKRAAAAFEYNLSDRLLRLQEELAAKTYRPGGGLTSARKLLDAARVMGVPCLFHDDVEMGVSLAAASHIIGARFRDLKFKPELSGYPEWIADDVVTPPFKLEGGYAEVPKAPGLGVDLDPYKIEKYSTGIITCQ